MLFGHKYESEMCEEKGFLALNWPRGSNIINKKPI